MNTESRRRAVIFTGGNVGTWSLALVRDDDYLIGADRGAYFLLSHGYTPHLALGDFDSISAEQFEIVRNGALEWKSFDAVDKDWTDTELAIREAIERGFASIVIVGGLGTRFDHSLANVHLLSLAAEAGREARLVDEHNEIRLCTDQCRLEPDERYPYVSLLPLSPQVTGIHLDGFAYPLHDATLKLGASLGISNRIVDTAGSISVAAGELLVIRSRD